VTKWVCGESSPGGEQAGEREARQSGRQFWRDLTWKSRESTVCNFRGSLSKVIKLLNFATPPLTGFDHFSAEAE
jgi:hypothetical protein